jgi:hypothetical protein
MPASFRACREEFDRCAPPIIDEVWLQHASG